MVQERIEAEKAKISAYQEDMASGVCVMPAFGGKLGMLRSVALDHHLNRINRNEPQIEDEEDCIETETFQARAKELIGADLFGRL